MGEKKQLMQYTAEQEQKIKEKEKENNLLKQENARLKQSLTSKD